MEEYWECLSAYHPCTSQSKCSERQFWKWILNWRYLFSWLLRVVAWSMVSTLFNFLLYFFIIGSTDMENLGPMEKQSLEGQRHQWPADDDRAGIHRPGRTVWTAMVQTPGKFFWWVLRKYCHQLMLLPDSRKRNHTDLRTFTAQRLRGSSVSRCWWRHSEGEENKYFWILAICTAWDLQGLSSHKSGSASFKWRSNLSIFFYNSPVFW